ncbi:MAG TPA: cation transporter, partial [Anaerolineae bacterium]
MSGMTEPALSRKDLTTMQEKQTPITHFQVKGMDCVDCARTIERGVRRLEGVTECTLSYSAATLQVRGQATREAVIARVRDLGYDVSEGERGSKSSETLGGVTGFIRYLLQRRETTLALVGAILIIPGLLLSEFKLWPAAPVVLVAIPSLAALLIAGYPVARSAWRAIIINREINMNVLMTVAAVGATFIGAYAEA